MRDNSKAAFKIPKRRPEQVLAHLRDRKTVMELTILSREGLAHLLEEEPSAIAVRAPADPESLRSGPMGGRPVAEPPTITCHGEPATVRETPDAGVEWTPVVPGGGTIASVADCDEQYAAWTAMASLDDQDGKGSASVTAPSAADLDEALLVNGGPESEPLRELGLIHDRRR